MRKKNTIIGLLLFINLLAISAPEKRKEQKNENLFTEKTFTGLKLRNIGPAFMSGRIADIAIHPIDYSIWYIAVGSGGVWKTSNAGVTFEPIFDKQASYSIGCVTIDTHNPQIVWVGTGENVGGRHVGFGDGIYKSEDNGTSWKNMGLKNSEHISKIIVHPENSDVVWVAAQGPLWSKGGDRGLYKSIDGGNTWKKTLGDDEWVGTTDVVIDPRNPDVLYAATWQRHRTIAALMDGGPGSGIYKSTDGGENWEKLKNGLPNENMGKIGIDISPINPDVLYAIIELNNRTGGVYKTTDKGANWQKQSNTVAKATGPHYYHELYASPHCFDRIYIANNSMLVSDDGGKTFNILKNSYKHPDDHALTFRKDDPDYLLAGTDGGIYESFDLGENWRYMQNLPVTQFYKVAVDDDKPFYNIYGGAQDNGTQAGPSRTDKISGITNADWEIILFGDGYQTATEPGNPDIVYAEWQKGNLTRIDRTNGEVLTIQPQPGEGEPYERFNWDAPILVSPHSPQRLYYASYRVWRSDNRGDLWTPISDNLTKNQNRIELSIMDKTWSYDSPWDNNAMSDYNTITSLAESPLQEGLIYAGTDDGLIQITDNGGKNWRKIEVKEIPGIPETAFVNDIKADLFDANTVYVALDNHKFGDFLPYLVKSTDKGKSWISMVGNLPKRTLVWRIVQDHEQSGLFFIGTEFGIYFTINGGMHWTKLSGDVPTISFRDLAIQRQENDLIGASFGRGLFILDDYSPLRQVNEEQLNQEATLFPIRKAWWYIPRNPLTGVKGFLGSSFYNSQNPPFGAVFTYYLSKNYQTLEQLRTEREKNLIKENKDVPFPGWDALEKEQRQEKPQIWLTVKDMNGNVIRKIEGPITQGFHRVAWDLKHSSDTPIVPVELSINVMAAPGKYTVTLSKLIDGITTQLSEPIEFEVSQLYKGALEGSTPEQVAAFWKEFSVTFSIAQTTSIVLYNALEKVDKMREALNNANVAPGEIDKDLHYLREEMVDILIEFNGLQSKRKISELNNPTIFSRLFANISLESTYGPTETHRKNLDIVKKELAMIKPKIDEIINKKIPEIEKKLIGAGSPWIEGQPLPDM